MWIFRKIKEKKQAQIEECLLLINQIQNAKTDFIAIFDDKSEFVTVENIASWKGKYSNLNYGLNQDTLAKLRKVPDYNVLTKEANDLSAIFSSDLKSKNIFIPIGIHFIHNGILTIIQILLMFI